MLPREYYQRPVFSLFGTERQWKTDAQLNEQFQRQKQLKVLQERVRTTNGAKVSKSKSRSPKKENAKVSPVEEAQAAEIMKMMNTGACKEVINVLTTHDKIKMMHGIMQAQKLAVKERKNLAKEVSVVNKYFET